MISIMSIAQVAYKGFNSIFVAKIIFNMRLVKDIFMRVKLRCTKVDFMRV